MSEKDIFISYKNDGEGNNFAARLCGDLEKMGYDVYYNPNEQHAGNFPNRLRTAVENCKDFLLVLTRPCLEQLMRHEKIDWVREELLAAHKSGRNIIPLLMTGVSMPKDKEDFPEDLRFLADTDAIVMTDTYDKSPLDFLTSWIKSKPDRKDPYKETYNSNPCRNIDEDFENAVKGSQSDPGAMYELANLYFYGLVGDSSGCSRDYHNANLMLENILATENEYTSNANSFMAEMYYHGIVPRQGQSYAKALEHHEKSQSGFSAREAAYLRSRGCGCDFDYDSIVEHYLQAIEKGDNVAIMGLAKFYISYGKFHEAAELYQKASNVLPDAKFQLGMMYRDGVLSDPPKPDFFKAAFYFQHATASKNCSSDVYHQLGRLFFTPVGDFPRDFKEAEKNFKIAADMGNKEAQYKLGLMYEYGYVEYDLEKAIYYHTKAAEQGVAFSSYHLALLYQNKNVRNYQEACRYAEISAKKGVMEGEFLFGVFLYYGRGCVADEDRAFKYLTKAYNHGMNQAKIYLDKISGGNK